MLKPYIQAGFAAMCISTVEESRFLEYVRSEFKDKTVYVIAATGGVREAGKAHGVNPSAPSNYVEAFKQVSERPDVILVVSDWQHLAKNPAAYRPLKMLLPLYKSIGSHLLFIAPHWQLPPDLSFDIPVLDWALPNRDELRAALNLVADSVGEIVVPEVERACLDAAAGLTQQAAEDAFALSVVECGALNPARIAAEKARLVRSSGFLEIWPAVSPDAVGGLDALKQYFIHEVLPARDMADLRVKGLLMVGVPGCGKSLIAKSAGALLGWPVLRMDIGTLKGSLVGQSESNMKAALRLVEAVAPAVLFLDEIEKGVGGFQSSAQSDSGVLLGMVGQLLTWLQENTAPVLTIATANNHAALPPELTRAGRFDATFFLDLPSRCEREQIASIRLVGKFLARNRWLQASQLRLAQRLGAMARAQSPTH